MRETFVLNEENIDIVSCKVFSYLGSKKYLSGKELAKIRISLETILLQWLEHGGADKYFQVEVKKSLGRLHVFLSLEGEQIVCEKKVQNEEEFTFFNVIEENLGSFYSVKYVDGTNIADIKLPRPPVGSISQILIAVALASILGYILPMLFPEAALNSFSRVYLKPAFSAIIGVLAAFASFQILFSIIESIVNMGNIAVLKSTGLKYLKLVLSTMVCSTFISLLVLLSFFPVLSQEGAVGGGNFEAIYRLIVDIVPTNIVKPFATGNLLQIVFLASFLGTILLILGDEVAGLNRNIRDIDRVFKYAVTSLSKLMPIFIFLSFLSLILNGQLKLVFDSWRMLLGFSCSCLVISAFELVLTAFFSKISIGKLIKTALPSVVLGLSTASSISTIPLLKKALEAFNVSETSSRFSMNFGLVLSKHCSCVAMLTIIIFYHSVLERTLDLGELIILAVSCLFLAIAAPSIPGGSTAIIANLMGQYNIPLELVAAVLSVYFIIDMIITGGKVLFMNCEGVMLDKILK